MSLRHASERLAEEAATLRRTADQMEEEARLEIEAESSRDAGRFPGQRYLSLGQAAELLGCSYRTVIRLRATGRLKCVEASGLIRTTAEWAREAVEGGPSAAAA